MNQMLKELVKIKTFRKNRAETELAVQRKKVLEATEALRAAEVDLEDYIIQSTQQEKSLFQKILNQQVKLRKIEDMQHEVSLLREGVIHREEIKREAHADLNVCQHRLHEAQKAYQLSVRIEEKFLTLTRFNDQTMRLEAERLSDLELEEVPVSTRHIDEWEYHDE